MGMYEDVCVVKIMEESYSSVPGALSREGGITRIRDRIAGVEYQIDGKTGTLTISSFPETLRLPFQSLLSFSMTKDSWSSWQDHATANLVFRTDEESAKKLKAVYLSFRRRVEGEMRRMEKMRLVTPQVPVTQTKVSLHRMEDGTVMTSVSHLCSLKNDE